MGELIVDEAALVWGRGYVDLPLNFAVSLKLR